MWGEKILNDLVGTKILGVKLKSRYGKYNNVWFGSLHWICWENKTNSYNLSFWFVNIYFASNSESTQNLWVHVYCAVRTLNNIYHIKISCIFSTLPSLSIFTLNWVAEHKNSQRLGRVIFINIRWDTFNAWHLSGLLFQKCIAHSYTSNQRVQK